MKNQSNPFTLLLSRLITTFLILSLFLSPVSVIFAQEVTIGSEIIPTETAILEIPNSTNETNNAEEVESDMVGENTQTVTETQNTSNISSAQQTLKPKTDLNTGALTFEYPIQPPAGRNGHTPEIKLQYSSRNNANDSAFGYGWSINLPYIERINKDGTDKLYTENYFYSSSDGELVSIGGGVFRPKTESGNFSSYIFANDSWVVTDKAGTVYKFGDSGSARQDDPNNSAHIYKWMLEETRDTNGNSIFYTYHKNAGQIYPSTINYAGIFEVVFLTQSRADTMQSYATGFLVTTSFRINEIQTKINNVWARKYILNYTTGDNGMRSMLASIVESGQDMNNVVTTLPAASFEYQHSTNSWTQSDTAYLPPHNEPDSATREYQQMIDINGDSYSDIIDSFFHNSSSQHQATYLSTGNNNWVWNDGYSPPILFHKNEVRGGLANVWDQGVRVVDVDGNQLPDIIESRANPNGAISAYKNTSNGWSLTTLWNPTIPFIETNLFPGIYAIDLNADALTDILKDQGNSQNEQINNGSGFNAPTTVWDTPISDLTFPIARIVDVNGDHLPDILENYFKNVVDGVVQVKNAYINKGNGEWQQDNIWAPPVPFEAPRERDNHFGVNFVDINGDSLMDLIMNPNFENAPDRVSYLNTGSGWAPANFHTPLPTQFFYVTNHLTDLNADGLIDALKIYTNFIDSVVHNGLIPDILSSITLPSGGKVDITYKSSARYKDANNNLLNPKLPFIVQTVNTITTNDRSGNISTTAYSYEGGSYFFQNHLNRKFAGFNKVVETDSAQNTTTTLYHQGNASDSTRGEFNDDEWKIGKPYSIEIANSSGHIFSKIINKWEDFDLGSGSKFVKLAHTVDATFDGDSTHQDKAIEYIYDNTNGNILQKTEYGEVAGIDDGSFTDIGNDKFVTSFTYATANTQSQIATQNTTDQNGNKVKESRYYYDILPLGQISVGNLTKQEDWKSGTAFVNIQKSYNNFGLLTSSIDPLGNAIDYTYDSNNLYPIRVRNALSQATNLIYNNASGQVIQKTDPNGRIFQYVYDGFGRLLLEKQPDLTTPTTLVTKSSYIYTDTPNTVRVQQTDHLDGIIARETFQYFDGLGRKIQERRVAEIGYNVKDYAYNNRGLLEKESLPYISSGASKTIPTTTSALLTHYTYDPMQRVVTTTNILGVTTNAYNDWKLTITDANGKAKDLYKDAFGNLTQVDEKNALNTYVTFYTYNYLGNLSKITDALGNIRNFTYDGLGRRLTAEDLHTITDTTFGIYFFSYDDAGNLTQKITPNGGTVNYMYDALNRPLLEKLGTVTKVTNTYDSGEDGIGRLTNIITPALNQTNTYNVLGGIKSEAKVINSITYITNYDYDRLGNQTLISNPDNSQIKYLHNSAGLLESVQRKENADTVFTDVVINFDYSPTEQPTSILYANGVTTTNTYDATKLYRLISKVSMKDGTRLQDLSYTYDAVGNITRLIDASNTNTAKTADYVYDDLYRLISATITNVALNQEPYTENYTYNALGNILSKNGEMYNYAGVNLTNPHTPTSIGNVNYTYDHNGNMISETGGLFNTWDYNNRLTQTVKNSITTTYDYDQTGQRIKYANANSTIYYPSKYFNIDSAGKITKHIFGNGLMLSTITTPPILNTGLNPACHPPESGDWTLATSCTFTGFALAPASVIVNANKVLTLAPNAKLLIDLKHFKLLVKATAGVLIKKTATLRQVKTSDTNTAPVIAFILTDNLLGSSIITDQIGTIIETTDYFPYGSIRLDIGSLKEQRKFIGQEYDQDTGLNYLNARYYDGNRGQFISQDSMFWQLPQELLIDPQQQNSYSYARNNPITLSDPTGKSVASVLGALTGAKTAYAPAEINFNYQRTNNTILSIPLRDNNINSKSGKITGDVYSLVKNQNITLNNTNHSVKDGKKATSLDGVQPNTIFGAIDFKQSCSCDLVITGGTEKGEGNNKVHGPDHWNGLKLDFRINNNINNLIQNNFDSTGIRGDGAPGYKDNLGNGFWRESNPNHWDVKFNQSYQFTGPTLTIEE